MYQDPPFKLTRNSLGLIADDSVTYVYNEDGTVNWRKMVKEKYLVPNKQLTEEKDITKLDDSKLLITLGGIRNLALVRGFLSVEYNPIISGDTYVLTSCHITWIPCYETSYNSISFEALADASPDNTVGFGMRYLAATAENRSFVRCVRNFLNINVVGEEEVSALPLGAVSESAIDNPTPTNILKDLMAKKKVSFDDIKAKLIDDKVEGAENYNSVDDMSQVKIFEFIKKIQEYVPA